MNKEFIPYEEALVLKELGFNEPCFAIYRDVNRELRQISTSVARPRTPHTDGPLWQQAFRFFQRWQLYGYVVPSEVLHYNYIIESNKEDYRPREILYEGLHYITHEQAQLVCLQELIKIVKNGK